MRVSGAPYAPKRPRLSKADRKFIFEREGGCCYLCRLPIADGEEWDADHEFARELGGSDGIENLRPAHKPCHRQKSKADRRLIAKGNRLRRANGPVEDRRKPKVKMRSRTFAKGRKMQSRNSFQKRGTK